ncbi:50S ribosomal protein L4 [Caldisericum exile]|uniref:Large ribosomal subunit protein uL4 n=1 Tax=Caldisericum exile (strain DSM 21853 / NBRC 104410 / AZM16c01) TaxID=511051 RepID=A0A7U6GFA0_CALEA|nr:50S ribosomal protein L4 [Caldisericum exile]BAL81266.1 50S ribosomal protein L4 [Caldisericum exile AZM16c01]
MKSNVIDVKNNTVESLELPDDYFAREVKKHLIYQAVQRYLANRRRGTADTKERGDVSYSTKKVRPQKGLGRSRQGARTSNIWKGGAVVFGPHPRDFSKKMNKKEIDAAIFSALTARFNDGDVHIVSNVKLSGKTKEGVEVLKKIEETIKKNLGDVLFVYSEENGEVERALRNVPTVKPLNYKFLNAYDLMVFDSIVLSKEAVEGIEGWWK